MAQAGAAASVSKPIHAPPPERSGAKVVVACKLPNGLVMQLHRPEEWDEPVLGGGYRKSTRHVPDGNPITAHGWRVAHGETPKITIAGGYALTSNVPGWFWDRWLKENEGAAVVTNKLIFAYERPDEAKGVAKEHASIRSGLEPLNMARKKEVVNGTIVDKPVDVRVARDAPKVTTKTEDD
jgi:hypothetical protein